MIYTIYIYIYIDQKRNIYYINDNNSKGTREG